MNWEEISGDEELREFQLIEAQREIADQIQELKEILRLKLDQLTDAIRREHENHNK